MTKVWNQVQLLTAKGATAGTYDEFTEIKTKKGARYILGFYLAVIDEAVTDGENGIPRVRINSVDLGISNLDVVGPTILPDGDAATTTTCQYKMFYPFVRQLPDAQSSYGITFSI